MKNKAFTLGEHESTSKSGEEMGEWLFGREKTLLALATELIIIFAFQKLKFKGDKGSEKGQRSLRQYVTEPGSEPMPV